MSCSRAALTYLATTVMSLVAIGATAQDLAAPPSSRPEVAAEHLLEQTAVEVVLVTGEQPGPGLWKVSRGDNVMWVLGTHSPLPKAMSWRSAEVERAIADSQEILTAGGFNPRLDIGWYKIPFLLPSMFRAARNPQGAQLADLLPQETYAEWSRLKAEYLGRDRGIERWRPAFAWEKLYGKAFSSSGLSYDDEIWPVVDKLAKKHKVKITDTTLTEKLAIVQPKRAMREFSQLQLNDIECFSDGLRHLDRHLTAMKQSANAWSVGDLEAFQEKRTSRVVGCQQVVFEAALRSQFAEGAGVEQFLEQGHQASLDKWLGAVEHALNTNRSTIALLSLDEILDPNGRLAKLVARGYTVEPP